VYGGAALLVREVAVRTGRGWRGVLLLGAAWGVLMPGVIDLALFGAHRDDVAYWDQLREPTLVDPLGIGVFNTITWVSGHVLLSVFAPLGLLHALAPTHRGRPLLGRAGIVVVGLLLLLAASFIHADGRRIYDYAPSPGQVAAVLAVVVALAAVALGPLGRAGRGSSEGPALPAWRPVALAVGWGAGGVLVPPTWAGVGVQVLLLGTLALVVSRWARTRRWGAREVGLVAAGLVLAQTLAGFASPTPDGVDVVTKTLSQLGLLALALGLLLAVVRSGRRRPAAAGAVDRVRSTP
jgi:hypothetical protein